MSAEMLVPLVPVLLLAVALIGWSLVDIARGPVQHLPAWAWALIVVLAIPLGAVVYLVLGRARGRQLRDEDLR
ncbi:PLD nuclease N-terminal domain-containing protein [Brevibacterium album]|uniref:PLD nuclease N-terminal domain-containing protein n=1 Tax=Brevibacterium album TaxID=417948 RepID=UPI00041D9A2B|nr:PLD nuclease N-terminal domain-containing protein [Brevibacterium album]